MTGEDATRVESAAPRPMPWLLIWATCLATFTITASGSTRTPFLIDMSRDLDVSLAMVANLFGITSIAWGLASFFAGIDRKSRWIFHLWSDANLDQGRGLFDRHIGASR